MMAGRPPTLEGQRTEILMEIQALNEENARNSIKGARLARQLNELLCASTQTSVVRSA